jgi:hypothetical protein
MGVELAEAISDSIRADQDIRATLDRLVDSGMLRSHLIDSLKGQDGEILAYHHPNGFAKIRLLGDVGHWALRIHFWSGAARVTDVHNHSWDFASRVLVGALVERQHHVVGFGSGAWKMSECRRISRHKYVYRQGPRCDILQSSERRYGAGDSYLLRHSCLHEARPAEDQVVTVVLQGPDLLTDTTVIFPADRPRPEELLTDPIPLPELEDYLWQVLDHLPA